jgi:hypothetical protein
MNPSSLEIDIPSVNPGIRDKRTENALEDRLQDECIILMNPGSAQIIRGKPG